MDDYVDLSCLMHLALVASSLGFVSMVDAKKLRWWDYLLIFLFTVELPFVYFFPTWFILLLFALGVGVPFLFSHRKNGIWMISEFFFAYYFLTISILIFEPGIPFYHGLLMISKPKTILWIFASPVFLLLTFLSAKFVDRFYHFHRYRQDVIMQINEKKYRFRAYYDTGNTLLHKGLPVIFITSENEKLFASTHAELLSAESVSGKSSFAAYLALLAKDGKKYQAVYVAISKQDGFHGCECLLNAYL